MTNVHPGPAAPAPAEPSKRSQHLAALGAAGAVLAVSVAAWLFAPGGAEPGEPRNLEGLASVDGTLTLVEADRMAIRAFEPVDGRRELTFAVRSTDQRNFDLAHLRSHSSVALPTRLYYEREGNRLFAVYKEDAPANSARTGSGG